MSSQGFSRPVIGQSGALVIPAIQSDNYVQGQSGWAITKTGGAQVDGITVLEGINAGDVNTQTLEVLTEPTIAGAPASSYYTRLVGYSTAQVGTNTPTVSSETVVATFQVTGLMSGRLFHIHWIGYIVPSTTNDDIRVRMRYTTNGSTPTTASAVLGMHEQNAYYGTHNQKFSVDGECTVPVDNSTLTIVLTLERALGTGTVYLYQQTAVPNAGTTAYVWDCGAQSNIGGNMSVVTGGTTPTNYVKTYNATWSTAYNADCKNLANCVGGNYCWGAANRIYQGYYSGGPSCDMKSLIGFPWSTIASDLSGYASISYIHFVYRVQYTWYSSPNGTDFKLGTHNNTSSPNTYGGANTDRWDMGSNRLAGSTYTFNIPSPSTLANELVAGTTRGMAIGPYGSSSYAGYGYIYGYGSGYAPQLIISYSK